MGVEVGVVLVHVHGRAGERLQLGRAADVVDMGVGDHDGLDREPVPVEDRGDVRNIIAWIDDNSLAGLLVAENRAVALQHADRKNLVNHNHDCILGVGMQTGYNPMGYKPFGAILVAARQKVLSKSAFAAHYCAWLRT